MRPLLLLSFGSFVAVVSLAMRSPGADFALSGYFACLSWVDRWLGIAR